MARKYTWTGLDPQQEESIARTRAQEEARAAVGRQMVTSQAAVDAALAELLAEHNTESSLFLTGAGSPEGAVVGSVAAIYIQTDGANGKTLWVKRTGSGNTGWAQIKTDDGALHAGDWDVSPDATPAQNFDRLSAAYAAAHDAQTTLWLPRGIIKYAGELNWNSSVNVFGMAGGNNPLYGTTLRKMEPGTIGIKLGAGFTSGTVIGRFTLDSGEDGTGLIGGNGIEVDTQGGGGGHLQDMTIAYQGDHGLLLRSGNLSQYSNVSTEYNGGDGTKIESFTGVNPAASANACTFIRQRTHGNGGIGLNIEKGDSHFFFGHVSEANVGWGVRLNDITTELHTYCEQNGAGGVQNILLTANAIRNHVHVVMSSPGGSASLSDLGTNNGIFDYANATWKLPSLTGQNIVATTGLYPAGGFVGFPAGQIPSADPNALDDYEEGTCTPADASGAALAFTNVEGHYTKIGRRVTVHFRFTFPATADGTINAIGGLPFTSKSGVSNGIFAGMLGFTNLGTPLTIKQNQNSTEFNLVQFDGVTPTNAVLSGKDFRGTVVYIV